MGGHYGVVVQVAQYLCVLGVGQVVDNIFQLTHNLLDGLVVARTEEYVDGVRQMQQLVLLAVLLDLLADLQQVVRVECVDRILDNHLLAIDVAMGAQSQNAHKHLLVHIDVEYHRVVVSLVGKEAGDRGQYHG